MNASIPGKITSSVDTLGRGLVTIGSIIFLAGFIYGAILIGTLEQMVSYHEWPFSFTYIPLSLGCAMIIAGSWLWHKRWKADVDFQQWKNNQLKQQDIPIREFDGEKYRFDMDQELDDDS